jgi:hypothetical protein
MRVANNCTVTVTRRSLTPLTWGWQKAEPATTLLRCKEFWPVTSANRKKFEELMARVGTVQDGICPDHGLVKMTINYKNHGTFGNDHRFYGVCERRHEWQIAQFYGNDL